MGGRDLLLVLDNCEHLVRAVAELVIGLLRACPGVRVLATSRAPLQVPGEVTWRTPPLPVPAADAEPVTARSLASVQLFADRAVAARPAFVLDDDSVAAVVEICRRLDGIPLALELAAARLRVLDVGELAERLERRLCLLSDAGPALVAHHRTLQAALDWSYDLLGSQEQVLLPRLSIFAGGATLATVEAMFGHDRGLADVAGALFALVEQSLVTVTERPRQPTRYGLLETVREWSAGRADETELAEWRARHAEHCLAFAQATVPQLCGRDQVAVLAALDDDHDNIRAALSWCVTAGDPSTGLALSGAMWMYWWRHGHVSEGQQWVTRLLDAAPDADPLVRASALLGAAHLSWKLGESQDARAEGHAAERIFDELGFAPGIAAALGMLGMAARDLGDSDQAAAFLERSLALCEAGGDRWAATAASTMLVSIVRDRGDEAEAGRMLAISRSTFTELGDLWGIGWTEWLGGRVATRQGRFGEAEDLLRRSMVGARQLRSDFGVVVCLSGLAGVAAASGRPVRGGVLLGASIALERVLGYPVRAFEREDSAIDEAALAAQLDPDELDGLLLEGGTLGWDQAVVFALTDDERPPAPPSSES